MTQGVGQPTGGFDPNHGPAGYGPPGQPPWLPPQGSAWSPTEAIDYGWRAVTADFAGIALPLAVLAVVVFAADAVVGGVLGGLEAIAEKASSVGGSVPPLVHWGLKGSMHFVQQVVTFVIEALTMGGMVEFCLKVVRGAKPPFGTVFQGARYFLPMLVGSILLSVGTGLGLLLCLVPGIILALGCFFWSFVVVDRGVSGLDALKDSWTLTQGHKGTLFVFGVLAVLVMLAGVLACCLGAVLVSLPLLGIATAHIYLKLRGEEPASIARS